jgi:hypothetical protein
MNTLRRFCFCKKFFTPPPPRIFPAFPAKPLFLLLAAALLSAALIACPNPSGSGQPVVTGVTVSPGTAAVVQGRTQTFTAFVSGISNSTTISTHQAVTWMASGGGAGTAITPGGVLIVAAGETAASLTVTAVSTVDPGKSGAAGVTILPAALMHAAGWGNGLTVLHTFTATSLTVVSLLQNQTCVIDFSSIIPATDRLGQSDYKTGFTFTGTINSNTITSGSYARDDSGVVVDNKTPGTAHVMTWYISNDGQSIIDKYKGDTYTYTSSDAYAKQ